MNTFLWWFGGSFASMFTAIINYIVWLSSQKSYHFCSQICMSSGTANYSVWYVTSVMNIFFFCSRWPCVKQKLSTFKISFANWFAVCCRFANALVSCPIAYFIQGCSQIWDSAKSLPACLGILLPSDFSLPHCRHYLLWSVLFKHVP